MRMLSVFFSACLISTAFGVASAAAQEPEPVKHARLLPALYSVLGATQTLDLVTTSRALANGAHEANPLVAESLRHPVQFVALKAAATATTVLFVHRLSKRNRTAAVVVLAAIDSAVGAVAVRNIRNARLAARRR